MSTIIDLEKKKQQQPQDSYAMTTEELRKLISPTTYVCKVYNQRVVGDIPIKLHIEECFLLKKRKGLDTWKDIERTTPPPSPPAKELLRILRSRMKGRIKK